MPRTTCIYKRLNPDSDILVKNWPACINRLSHPLSTRLQSAHSTHDFGAPATHTVSRSRNLSIRTENLHAVSR